MIGASRTRKLVSMRLVFIIFVAAVAVAFVVAIAARGHVSAAPVETPTGWKWGDDSRS